MKIELIVIRAEGNEETIRGALGTLEAFLGHPAQENGHAEVEAETVPVVVEVPRVEVEAPRVAVPRMKQAKKVAPAGIGIAVSQQAPSLRPHNYRPGVKAPVEWERCKLTKAKQDLFGPCELCSKQIKTDQFYRAPVSNPTRRAHDDCVQARADAQLQD